MTNRETNRLTKSILKASSDSIVIN